MSCTLIPVGECGLLSRRNARRYCGGLGEERFDRTVGPYVTPLLIGSERFYARSELDAWINRGIGRDDTGAKRTSDEEWARIFEQMSAPNAKKVRGKKGAGAE